MNGTGTMGASPVTNVAVTCATGHFFLGDDGMNGNELWRTDGTDSGTVMVKDINPTGNGFTGW